MSGIQVMPRAAGATDAGDMKIVNYAAYIDSAEQVARLRPAHREYMTQLRADGVLVLGGPFADGSGALCSAGASCSTSSPPPGSKRFRPSSGRCGGTWHRTPSSSGASGFPARYLLTRQHRDPRQYRQDTRIHPRFRGGSGRAGQRTRGVPRDDLPVPGPDVSRCAVGIGERTHAMRQ